MSVRLLIALVLCLFGGVARAQMTLTGAGAGAPAATTAYVGPGDIQTFTAWYSCAFGYSAAYAAARTSLACNIRRISDDAQLDIAILPNGVVDIAYATSFCASTTCAVTKMYDQTGGGRDILNITKANQPAFIFNGLSASPTIQMTIVTQILFSSANFTPASGLVSFSVVAKRATGSTVACPFFRQNGAGATSNRLSATSTVANSWTLTGGTSGTVNATAADNAFHAGNMVMNGASSVVAIDGSETTGTATGSTAANTIQVANSTATCDLAEAGFVDNVAVTGPNRTSLNDNQHLRYGF